ncbi:MAG: leucine-rich repeat protein [Alphaproteobacteria bacterium]|nr:leucine-rich repeat protein [Alphaproteobacteria bacterium]
MRKVVLMFGVVVCFAGESLAETWNCGPATDGVYSDSVQCTYDEATKTLTISGEGEMGNYASTEDNGSTAPWFGKDIVHAVIEGNVTSIGARTFKHAYNLTDIKGTENIISVGNTAFSYTSLKSINLPNVQKIGYTAFLESEIEYINIPENVIFGIDSQNRSAFVGTKIPHCDTTNECWNCGEKFVQAGVGCVSSCPEGYTSYYGFCTRTRYTIPEADAATSNDNENTIEWIFE